MPRYRFRWETIPVDVRGELADELELTGDTLVQLRRRYGARPTTKFVRDLWSTLRDGWLTRDAEARAWVVQELRSGGLGDPSIADDLRYLASCRNAETLRRTVLVAFHDLGEERPEPTGPYLAALPEPADHPGVTRRPGPAFDLDLVMDAAWLTFSDRLTELLTDLDAQDSLIIGLPTAIDPADLVGVAPYIQFIGTGADFVHGEVSGNAYLDSRLQLTEARQHSLAALGWTAPTAGGGGEFDEGSSNFVADIPRTSASRLVDMVVATVRDVFDVPHPSFLELPAMSPAPTGSDDSSAVEQSDLRTCVQQTLAAAFDHPIVLDEDGDIPIRSGSAMVFVRVATEVPVVELFSPLLIGASGDALALERINRANRNIRFAKLTWTGGRVLANHEIWCDPFVPELLLWAVGLMMNLADEMDDRLRPEVGGRRFFEDVDAVAVPAGQLDSGGVHPALATITQLAPQGSGLTAAETARICDHSRDLVLHLITDSENQADRARKSAAEAGDPAAAQACVGEATSWDATAALLRTALREIVLG